MLALAGALVAWSATAGWDLPARRHPAVQAGLGTALAVYVRSRLAPRQPQRRAGMQLGAVSAAVVATAVAAGTAVPSVRAGMSARTLPEPGWKWLAWQIPVGTVWSEEMAYRAALGPGAIDAFGPRAGQLIQAGAFGLSHVYDARAAGESVLGTVLVTGAAGWVFGWLSHRSGSTLASVLAHLAVNEAGAVAAQLVQRHDRRQ